MPKIQLRQPLVNHQNPQNECREIRINCVGGMADLVVRVPQGGLLKPHEGQSEICSAAWMRAACESDALDSQDSRGRPHSSQWPVQWPIIGTAASGFEFTTSASEGDPVCPLVLCVESQRGDLVPEMLRAMRLREAPLAWREHAGRLAARCITGIGALDTQTMPYFLLAVHLLAHGAVLPNGIETLQTPISSLLKPSRAKVEFLNAMAVANVPCVDQPHTCSALAALVLFIFMDTEPKQVHPCLCDVAREAFFTVISQDIGAARRFRDHSGNGNDKVGPSAPGALGVMGVLGGGGASVLHICTMADDPELLHQTLKLMEGVDSPEFLPETSLTESLDCDGLRPEDCASSLGHHACARMLAAHRMRLAAMDAMASIDLMNETGALA